MPVSIVRETAAVSRMYGKDRSLLGPNMRPYSFVRRAVAASAVFATPVGAALAQVVVTPNTAPPPLENVQATAVDFGPGKHFDPHIDGALISYTTDLNDGTGDHIWYFRLGIDSA